MSKEQFTPGRWVVEMTSECYLVHNDLPISKHDKYSFETVAQTMSEANANLIAASPDMYEALKEVLEFNGSHYYLKHETRLKVEAALNKANPSI